MDPQKERELIEKAKESLEAFDKLYEYYLPKIYTFILNRTACKEIAEDIASQTFVAAMLNLKKFKYTGVSFGAWLYRIAHNRLVDYYRQNKHSQPLDASNDKSTEKTEETAEQDEKRRAVLEALKYLPEQYQQVLTLKYFEELDNEEIANVLGCKKETMAVKLHRSLKALKKVMERPEFATLT